MTFQAIVGKIENEYEKVQLDWKIENFLSLVQNVDNRYHSLAFDCYGESFYLQIYPNGEKRNESEGWLSVYLVLRENCSIIEAQFQFAIKTADGDLKNNISVKGSYGRKGKGWGIPKFLERTVLLSQLNEWLPSGALTITVSVETGSLPMKKNTDDVCVQTDFDYINTLQERQQVKRATSNKSLQVHFENSISEETNDANPPKTGPDKVLQDISKVWLSGDNSDVVVRVKDVEFRAHKVILGARSPVLFAMFQHDTAESRSGEIKIGDCEPGVFQEYLHYIYNGVPQKLTSQNAAALYTVAEKYLTDDLKAQCLKYIQSNLDVDTFCETVMLALNYGETELLQQTTDYASENIRKIIKSVEWQRFIQNEPTTANEILIKALDS